MEKKDFSAFFEGLIEEFSNQENNISLDDFIILKLKAAGIQNADNINDQLTKVVSILDKKYDSLQTSKKAGMSRQTWLHHEMKSALKDVTQDQAKIITANLTNALNETGVQLNCSEKEVPADCESVASEPAELIADLDAKIVEATCLSNHEVFVEIKNNDIPMDGNPIIKKAVMENDIPALNAVRKLAAVSLLIQEKEADKPIDPIIETTDALIIADRGTFETQVQYQAGKFKITKEDAIERLIDRTAVQVATWTEITVPVICEKGGECVGSFVGTLASKVFGPAAIPVCKKIGRCVGHFVGEVAVPIVKEGVRFVAEGAKSLYRGIKEVATSVWDGLKSAGRELLSLFS